MANQNHSTVSEFILTGLTEKPELQLPLFLLFLEIYVFTVVGNLGMITLIGLSSSLHTPMYYLLSSLSFIDLSCSTVITPKMLISFVTEKNMISYTECMTQLYLFVFFIISECHMLAAMAYDRYVAICSPLLYNVTMSPQVCCWMVAGVYSVGLVGATAHTVCIAFNLFLPTLAILSSYISIIASILRIRSTSGRSKAFSTCSSHISAVGVFFGSLAFMYLQPASVNSMHQKLYFSSVCISELLVLFFSASNTLMATLPILTSYTNIIAIIYSTVSRSKAFSTCSYHISAVSVFFDSCAFMYLKGS
ncbi:olfactory receptor 8G50-like [Cavia porcellus]|uniref:olfactory receptor 8G50-like n=1 Tax=Cavia porcellus TaxID=10141 RepID=UPI002FE40A56